MERASFWNTVWVWEYEWREISESRSNANLSANFYKKWATVQTVTH
jgi:hypothetical protein